MQVLGFVQANVSIVLLEAQKECTGIQIFYGPISMII